MVKSYSYRQMIIAVVAVFMFTYAYDMLVHGGLMKGLYIESASVWRTQEEMKDMLPLCFFLHFSIAAVFTSLFMFMKANNDTDTKKYPNLSHGLFFGVHIGLIMGVGMSFSYVMLPVSQMLGIAWFGAGLLKGIGVGLLLSFLFGRSSVANMK